MEKLYTLTQAASVSGYNDQHLRKLCREKKVAHTIRGSRYFFTAAEIEGLARHVAVEEEVAEIEKAEIKRLRAEGKAEGLLGYKKRRGKYNKNGNEKGE